MSLAEDTLDAIAEVDCVLKERGASYGSYADNCRISHAIFKYLLDMVEFSGTEIVGSALHLGVKSARLFNLAYVDSAKPEVVLDTLRDVQGYLTIHYTQLPPVSLPTDSAYDFTGFSPLKRAFFLMLDTCLATDLYLKNFTSVYCYMWEHSREELKKEMKEIEGMLV